MHFPVWFVSNVKLQLDPLRHFYFYYSCLSAAQRRCRHLSESSKTRSGQTESYRGFPLTGATPRGGGGSLHGRKDSLGNIGGGDLLSMGGETGHANLFCGSDPAWTQSVLNPLSRPGQQCARCDKDYEGEEDFLGGDEIFDFPQQGFFKGVGGVCNHRCQSQICGEAS